MEYRVLEKMESLAHHLRVACDTLGSYIFVLQFFFEKYPTAPNPKIPSTICFIFSIQFTEDGRKQWEYAHEIIIHFVVRKKKNLRTSALEDSY